MPKNILGPVTVMAAVDLSMNQVSTPMKILGCDTASIQLDITGTPSGTLVVQVSDNRTQNVDGSIRNAGTFATLTSGGNPVSATVTSGSPTPIFFDIALTGAKWIQLAWTNTGGTGTGTAVLVAKQV